MDEVDVEGMKRAASSMNDAAADMFNAARKACVAGEITGEAAAKFQTAADSFQDAVNKLGKMQDDFFENLDTRLDRLAKIMGKEGV